jgi:hypothetical protein
LQNDTARCSYALAARLPAAVLPAASAAVAAAVVFYDLAMSLADLPALHLAAAAAAAAAAVDAFVPCLVLR